MIVLSSLLRRAVYPAMSNARLFSRRWTAGEVGVITYHGIVPEGFAARGTPGDGTLVAKEEFRRQLRFLKSRYELIAPEDFHAWCLGVQPLPDRAVMVSCDDGLVNVLTEMLPVLEDEGVHCLFFVTGASACESPGVLWYEELYQMMADAPGDAELEIHGSKVRKDSLTKTELRDFWWRMVQELSEVDRERRGDAIAEFRSRWRLNEGWKMYAPGDKAAELRYRLLNREELKELARRGMTIGAHTMTHPLLARAPQAEAEREIAESRSQLESCLQQPVWALAYPFGNEGSAGEREMKLAQQAGFDCAFLNCGGGRSNAATPRFGLPRVHVTSEMGVAELEANLSGFHQSLQRWVGANGGRASAEMSRTA